MPPTPMDMRERAMMKNAIWNGDAVADWVGLNSGIIAVNHKNVVPCIPNKKCL